MSEIKLPLKDFQKIQPTRIVDVFLLGPYMVWFGLSDKDLWIGLRIASVVGGVATIANAANNFWKIAQKSKTTKPNELVPLSEFSNTQQARLAIALIAAPLMIFTGFVSTKPIGQRLPMIGAGAFHYA